MANNEINVINPHQWVSNYADYLYGYAVSRINDPEQSKDLVQETFLAALQNEKKFKGLSSEKTWLTSILKNKIFDIYKARSSGLKNVALCEAYPQFFNQADGHWKVECKPKEFSVQDKDAIQSKELKHVLEQCLKKLPVSWVAAFKMKFLDEENANDICNELKVTPSNYWMIIHRAKVNLRDCLQKHWL